VPDAPPPVPEPEEPPLEPLPKGLRFRGENFSSMRSDGVPRGTLQLVLFHDGRAGKMTLRLEIRSRATIATSWIEVSGIEPSTSDGGRIETREIDMSGFELTGEFEVEGVVPNGVIDGLAFGLLRRDDDGAYRVLRSVSPHPPRRACFVGAWPIQLSQRQFTARTPQLADGAARAQARMLISGAEYLDDGRYLMAVDERVATRAGGRAAVTER
jgi:hypothetical protein